MRKVRQLKFPPLRYFIIPVVFSLFSVGVAPQVGLAQTTVQRFLVSYFASHGIAEPQQSEAASTYISITNVSNSQCSTKVEWRNKSGSLVCTSETNTTVDPRLGAGGTVTHCSRAFEPFSTIPECDQACVFMGNNILEGSATVFIDTNCEGRVAVDSRTYFTAVSEVVSVVDPTRNKEIILSAHNPKIYKLNMTGGVE